MAAVVRLTRAARIAAASLLLLGATWLAARAVGAPGAREAASAPPLPDRAALEARLADIYQARAAGVVAGDPALFARFYAARPDGTNPSLDHERRRVEYVRAWSEARGVRFVLADVELRVTAVKPMPEWLVVGLTQSAGFGYVYRDDPEARVNRFGIGTRHWLRLVRRGAEWLIRDDWYIDPLDEDTLIPDVTPAGCGPRAEAAAPPPETRRRGQEPARYNRRAAVVYADTYCGAAWGCGNDRRYNPRYADYNGRGGDCTNFVSQVLGDPEGGGLPQDSVWYYRGGGSQAWVQTEALVRYLLRTGRAERIARGTYAQVVAPTEAHAGGAIAELAPGDIIGYEERGRIQHLAVVTARDTRGYVLVNSHTADRYHVPWDIGWDRKTVFWLLKMRD